MILTNLDSEIVLLVRERDSIATQLRELEMQVEILENRYHMLNGQILAIESIKQKEKELDELQKKRVTIPTEQSLRS